jgi:hypothetical protein
MPRQLKTTFTKSQARISAAAINYPIFGDYNIVTPPPASIELISEGIGTNGNFQLELLSASNTGFGIQASTDLINWAEVGSGSTDTNGLLLFQDTNTAGFSNRFYRAFWPLP